MPTFRTYAGDHFSFGAALYGADMNSTKDQFISICLSANSKYILRRAIVTNASTSLTTAVGGIYTTTAKGGTALISGAQAFASLTSPDKFLDLVPSVGTSVLSAAQLVLTLTTAQGAPATADVYVFGDILT